MILELHVFPLYPVAFPFNMSLAMVVLLFTVCLVSVALPFNMGHTILLDTCTF